jgi:hypothetical protein
MTKEAAPATGPGELRDDPEAAGPDQLKRLIGGQVLRALGGAAGKGRVEVRPLWEGHYRVNVVVGDSPGRVTIPHSYFLRADGAGNVLESTPVLPRQD